MDPYTQAGMIFSVVMTIIIGGFIVTFPIMRRLGRVMEESIRERQAARLDQNDRTQLGTQLEELRGAVHQLEGHVGLLAERQDFVDNLLSHREPGKLPEPDDWRRG